MRTAIIAVLVSAAVVAPAAAQVNAATVRPPAWQKAVTPTRALAAEDARARARTAYQAGKSPDALVAEIRQAFPKGGDEMVATALKEARAVGKAEVETLKGDGARPLGEAEQRRLQAAKERLSTFEQALSEVLRKMAGNEIMFIGDHRASDPKLGAIGGHIKMAS